jgi:hypothetical protein
MNPVALGVALALIDPWWPCPPEPVCIRHWYEAQRVWKSSREACCLLEYLNQGHGGTAADNLGPRLETLLVRARWECGEARELMDFWSSVWWVRWEKGDKQFPCTNPVPRSVRVQHWQSARAYLGDPLWFSGQWWREP